MPFLTIHEHLFEDWSFLSFIFQLSHLLWIYDDILWVYPYHFPSFFAEIPTELHCNLILFSLNYLIKRHFILTVSDFLFYGLFFLRWLSSLAGRFFWRLAWQAFSEMRMSYLLRFEVLLNSFFYFWHVTFYYEEFYFLYQFHWFFTL